ncbi:unknown protein [Desulfotalea psychrophila LSv54]|uniref:Uncharacterized protein n=1 Tax=Desulfotalea psychrophila (strain LSv54 / DSM 12343) TaxID=177439 RepID=Q6ANG2_DESPS|nr:unknown protein [Desulfotalea psychrophila LSv54]
MKRAAPSTSNLTRILTQPRLSFFKIQQHIHTHLRVTTPTMTVDTIQKKKLFSYLNKEAYRNCISQSVRNIVRQYS